MKSEGANEEVLYVIECEITPQDSLYYASREAGETFLTEPYLMHTALYYAFGIFPTRFRVAEQRPVYTDHRDSTELGTEAYIHPAVIKDRAAFHTRRFASKGDSFRSESSRGSGNFKETGHQKMVVPDRSFVTFITTTEDTTQCRLVEEIPPYIRVGKKMSNARVRTTAHTAFIESGEFQLDHPVSDLDLLDDAYDIIGDLHWKRMTPVDLMVQATLKGRHATVEPEFRPSDEPQRTVTLPVDTQFLARR